MTEEKRLYRSRDALVGGVCAGVADYFNVDTLVVRILTIVFTLASGGLLTLAYIALWVVVPKEPKVATPVDVEPQAVHSETYGAVECGPGRKGSAEPHVSAAQAASWRYSAPTYTGAAHVPPEPPAAATWVNHATVHQQPPTEAGAVPPPPHTTAAEAPFQPNTPPAYTGWVPPQSAPHQPQPPKEPSDSGVKAALWAGSFLLFFGVVAMVATFVEGASWWQYWPLIFVIVGIVRMVLPGKPGHRMRGFVNGLIFFFGGGTLLFMSLGLVGWHSLELMLGSLWPLLLMMLGLLILGNALDSPVLVLLAGACFVAFCVVGVVWYSVPGLTEQLVFTAPYGREYYFDVRP